MVIEELLVEDQKKTSEASLPPNPEHSRVKTYNRIKLSVGISSSILTFLLILALVAFGITRDLEALARSVVANDYMALIGFALLVGVIQGMIGLPLGFYSSYHIEHKYKLSNQTLWRWARERMKAALVGFPLGVVVLVILYYCLQRYGEGWWLPVSIALTLFSVVLARLAPTLIMPLFYKFTPLEDGSIKDRILRLCAEAGLSMEGIFSFNMSKNTKKANAGFTGIGKAKRIILGDTLLREFSETEIETVFAHELGHYKHHHIAVGIITGVVSTFLGLFLTSKLYSWSLGLLGFTAITEIAALPLLVLWLSIYGLVTGPLGHAISRRHEKQADRYAVMNTRNREAFISALRKLAAMNLADPEPHPLIEFLFYSHPSINRRVSMVEAIEL